MSTWVPLSIRNAPPPYFEAIAWAKGASRAETIEVSRLAHKLADDLAWCVGESPNERAKEAIAALLMGESEPARSYGVVLPAGWQSLGLADLLVEARTHSPAHLLPQDAV